MTDIIIAGVAYTPRTMTAGDVGAIVPIARRLQAIEAETGLLDMAEMLPDAIRATAAALGCDQVVIETLPLHEALEAIRQTLFAWLEINGPYLSEHVVPELTALTKSIVDVATALQQSPEAPAGD
jgi:hypothetical protein